MPSSLLDWCQSQHQQAPSVLLLDGGVSTFLEQELACRGETFSHRALWSSSLLLNNDNKPDIQNMHKAFRQAGADLLSTVTYQCHFGVQDKQVVVSDAQMTQMMQRGVQWAKQVVVAENNDSTCSVVASSGSYGGALSDGSEYTGQYGNVSLQELVDFHARKFKVFKAESPNAVAIETIPNLLECRTIVEMLKQQSKPVMCCWMSLACQNGDLLNDGSKLQDALDVIHRMDPEVKYVHGVGINCCDSLHVPSLLTRIVRHMARNNYRRVIVVYPNSGEQWDAQQSTWKEGTGCTSPTEFADRILEAIRLVHSTWAAEVQPKGDSALSPPKMIVGGCCRTSPTTIAAIRQRLDAMESTCAE